MATGGDLSGSMSKGSEFVYDFDFTCSKCATKEASHYCQTCNIYFCKSCLHKACDHELLGRKLVSKWKPGQTTFILECPDHAGNRLETYCKTHDVVCCSTCVSLAHTQCVGLTYTPTSAMGVLKSQEIPKLQKRLSDLQQNIDKAHTDTVKSLKDAQQSCSNILQDIKTYRKKLDTQLDQLQYKTENELNKIKLALESMFQTQSQNCVDARKTVDQMKQALVKYKKDETNTFITLKQSKKLISNYDIMLQVIGTKPNHYVSVKYHPQIESVLKQMDGLCEIISDPSHTSKIVTTGPLSGSPSITGQNIRLNQQYKIKSKSSFNVKSKKDKKECNIFGMCVLPSGHIVLADHDNTNIKKVDKNYMTVDSLSLQSGPWDLCCVGDRELVVALGDKLQFITVGNTMSLSHSFTTSHNCTCVAYHKDKLAVTSGYSGRALYLYSLHCGAGSHSDPQLTHPIKGDMVSFPRYVTYSPDGSQLYVADGDKGLVTLDNAGQQLAQLSPTELQCARGVCVDSVGNVFVCGTESHNVLQVDSDGKNKVTTIAAKSDGINSPRAVCFDSAQSVLYVAELNSSLIKVFHLQQ